MSDSGDFSLLDLFREEVRSQTATLGEGLLDLEEESANPQKIEPLMRAAHSIKGAARIVGVDAAVGLAHVMEDAFVAAQAGKIRITAADIDVLLQGTDLLGELGQGDEAAVNEWGQRRQTEIVALTAQMQAIAQGAPRPAGGETRKGESPAEPAPATDREGEAPSEPAPPAQQEPPPLESLPRSSVRPVLVLPDEPIVPGDEHPLFDLFREEVRNAGPGDARGRPDAGAGRQGGR